MFEGYRDMSVGYDDCPYSPDSPRAFSWTMGRNIAKQDFGDKPTEGN